jgi:acetamidase/formamidase
VGWTALIPGFGLLADEFTEPWLRISREEAYALCSVAVDLRIHDVVDAPNWVVGAFLPDDIFTGGGNK